MEATSRRVQQHWSGSPGMKANEVYTLVPGRQCANAANHPVNPQHRDNIAAGKDSPQTPLEQSINTPPCARPELNHVNKHLP